jgi:hypothetical protein
MQPVMGVILNGKANCDASGAIANGDLNDCTSSLADGSECTPTCHSGYTLSGIRSCSGGTIVDTAVCISSPNEHGRRLLQSSSWTQVGADIYGEAGGDQSGSSVSMSSDGKRMAIGAPGNTGGDGHVRVYAESGGTWTQVGADIDGEATSSDGDLFGASVSMSSDGTRVAIGAYRNDGSLSGSESGHVRVYAESDGTWTQVGSDIDGDMGDYSGYSVSISSDGTRVAIGAIWHDNNAGRVRVYAESGGTWTQVGADIDGEAAGDNSGHSVSMSSDGTRVAIGAISHDVQAGHVRVYAESGGAWNQVGEDIDGEAAGDNSGHSVSMSSDGKRVAIGAPYNDGTGSDAGHVRVYAESGGMWTQLGADINGEAEGDASGWSVSMSSDGTRVAIGAHYNDGTGDMAGHVRVYAESDGTWTQVGADIDAEYEVDWSGYSVSMSSDGTRVAIGAPGANGRYAAGGHVRVYTSADPSSCDASTAPTNGAVGTCTSSLASGSTCQPTCNSGYTVSGSRSCSAGTLTDTVACKADSPAPSSASPPTLGTPQKAAAEKTRDKLLAGITDEKLKKKAKLLADAAIAGEKVKKMTAKLEAADAATACSDYYTKAKLSSDLGACVATVSSRRRGRSLAASTYQVNVFFRPSEVTSAQLTDASNSLKAEGVQGVTTESSVDPIAELKTVDGVDASTMATFETEAAAAAAGTSWAVGLKGGPQAVLACASALFVIALGM